jgi:CrcB protein
MAPPSTLRASLTLLAVIGAGGAIGTAARYGTALAIPVHPSAYPVATFLVNVVGAVILGGVAALPTGWLPAHKLTQPAIGTGFCGGLTTFSTMSLEIYERTPGHLATLYAVASLLAAPVCAWAGHALVKIAHVSSPGQQAPPEQGPSKPPEKKQP